MSAFWCVNFDVDSSVLQHGLTENLWLMQYQYSHDGHVYQGHPDQKGATTKNWKALCGIKPGDWLVAYLPRSRFFAIGEVVSPRDRTRYQGKPRYKDTVERTVRQHLHQYLQGVVNYTDAHALYEDFTDSWGRTVKNEKSQRVERWKYPQRIDVAKWHGINPDGVAVKGLSKHVSVHKIQLAAFEIPRSFFYEIQSHLGLGAWLFAKDAIPDNSVGEADFVPQDDDRRRLIQRQIRERRGQKQFRNALACRYKSKCVISGCEVLAVLEAAHINPYRGDEDNHPANGLLLRSDLHTLFDLDLLGINPENLRVILHPDVVKEYGEFDQVVLNCPAEVRPSSEALWLRYQQFQLRLRHPG
ncbi:hypothetical protein DSECCO2_397690 [anaerobic digester metagenome]